MITIRLLIPLEANTPLKASKLLYKTETTSILQYWVSFTESLFLKQGFRDSIIPWQFQPTDHCNIGGLIAYIFVSSKHYSINKYIYCSCICIFWWKDLQVDRCQVWYTFRCKGRFRCWIWQIFSSWKTELGASTFGKSTRSPVTDRQSHGPVGVSDRSVLTLMATVFLKLLRRNDDVNEM
jgi:hypothetical protein